MELQDDSEGDSIYDEAQMAADYIRAQHAEAPAIALILGTGLGGLAESIADATIIPYADIPHFPRSTVVGHAGRLVLGRLGGQPVAAMQGRFHVYEGYSPAQVVLPLRALHLLGAATLFVTNAAGGLDASLPPGALMVVRDHIGLPTMAGHNPLVGPNDDRLGPRFPAMTSAYDGELRALAHEVAESLAIPLRDGVYVMVSGPNYESPAELRFLRQIGADAVGMSTVPEVIAARHMGMRVLAVSCVTNLALPDLSATALPTPSHAEVVAAAERAGVQLGALFAELLTRLPR